MAAGGGGAGCVSATGTGPRLATSMSTPQGSTKRTTSCGRAIKATITRAATAPPATCRATATPNASQRLKGLLTVMFSKPQEQRLDRHEPETNSARNLTKKGDAGPATRRHTLRAHPRASARIRGSGGCACRCRSRSRWSESCDGATTRSSCDVLSPAPSVTSGPGSPIRACPRWRRFRS